MQVIVNATPFIALSAIEKLDLLPCLYKVVYVPEAVVDEVNEGGKVIVPDLNKLDWVKILPNYYGLADKLLFQLDDGERQVIIRGLEDISNSIVLLDDFVARETAHQLGLRVKGSLGVLVEAKRDGLISSFNSLAMAMREEGIHFSKCLIEEIAKELGEK